MKSVSKIIFVAALALTASATVSSAQASVPFAVAYEYPKQYSIESRALGTGHHLNSYAMPMTAMAMPEESKLSVVVTFPPNSDKLTPKAIQEVAKAAALIKGSQPGVAHVLVEGHTDSAGKTARNQELSFRRAVRVAHALVKKYGIPAQVTLAKGFGSMKPVAPNDTEAGRAANRRVDFVLINQ